MTLRIVNILGVFASVVGLIAILDPGRDSYSSVEILLMVLAGVFFVWLVISDIRSYLKNKPKRLNSEKIRDYLYKWIDNGSRVHVFSRDLSWVKDDAMKSMLEAKAARGELNITVPESIPIVNDLRKAGANINVYPELGYVPLSRFTIVNWERMDARVAVGRSDGNDHLVEEFTSGQHPVFSVANDLVQMATRFEREMEQCRRRAGKSDE